MENRKGICWVCGGEIVSEIDIIKRPHSPTDIIGPGAGSTLLRVAEIYHCSRCKIFYKEIPPPPARTALKVESESGQPPIAEPAAAPVAAPDGTSRCYPG